MATIGQTLSAARVAARYTVADLSARTRIRESVLRGIEEEDFVPCGGNFYARGHIRGVSRALGLDPAPLLAEYDREHASAGEPAFVPPPRHPVARPAAARAAAAAARNGTHTEDDGEATVVLRRFGAAGPTAGPTAGPAAGTAVGPERREHSERGPDTGRRLDGEHSEESAVLPAPRCGAEGSGGGREFEDAREFGGDRGGRELGGGRWLKRDREPRGGWEFKGGWGLRHDRGLGDGHGPRDRRPASRSAVTGHHNARTEAFRRHWPWAVVGILIVLGVVVGIRTWQDWDGDNPLRTAFRSNGGEEAVDSAVLPEEGADGIVAGKEAVAEELTEITVGLETSMRTWIQVIDAEGEGLFTGFLLEDEKQEYVSEGTLTLWVANAGAVSVSVNGEDLGPLGLGGEVKEVVIGPDGFEE